MQQAAKFEEVTINLPSPLCGVESLSAVVGIPEWWPTGSRVALAIAHDAGSDMNDPLVTTIHRELAGRKVLTIRFNFPFAERRARGSRAKKGQTDGEEDLERAYRAALSILGRDPAAAPSHLFLGGVGLGAQVAARLATARLQLSGVFMLGYPLHPPDEPDQIEADHLYRIIPPMLFVQGSQDPRCDLAALRRCVSRVGAPSTLRIVEQADGSLLAPDRSEIEDEAGRLAIAGVLYEWMEKVLGLR